MKQRTTPILAPSRAVPALTMEALKRFSERDLQTITSSPECFSKAGGGGSQEPSNKKKTPPVKIGPAGFVATIELKDGTIIEIDADFLGHG